MMRQCAQPQTDRPDPIAMLFESVSHGGRVDSLGEIDGTLRFDLHVGDQIDSWLLTVHGGQLTVSHRGGDADCVVDLDKDLANRMATGQTNAMTALLRADMMVTGDVKLLVLLERLLPGPAAAHGPRRSVHSRGVG
jgi:predicted lipid carrier protein YhbT